MPSVDILQKTVKLNRHRYVSGTYTPSNIHTHQGSSRKRLLDTWFNSRANETKRSADGYPKLEEPLFRSSRIRERLDFQR